jgi:outer membrane protein
MKLFTILILILLSCEHAFNQQPYSLEDCFNAAKENNIGLQRSQHDIESSYIDKQAAIFNLLPAVSVNAEHIFSSGKNIDPVTNNFVRDNFSGGDFNMTVELNIFSGFSALNAIKSSLYKIKAEEYAYQKNEMNIFFSITAAYAKVMYDREQVSTIRNNNQHTREELNVVQEEIDVGKLSKSDYYTINTRYKTEQADLVDIQNDSLTAINQLKYLIGLHYNTAFDIKDIDSTEIKSIVTKDFTLSEVLDTVLKNYPALLESMFEERSAEMNVKSAKGNLFPTLSFAGNIFSNYNSLDRNLSSDHISFGQQLNNNFGKTVGFVLQVPLFNKYQNRFAIEKEKINLSNAKLATQQIENDIAKNVQQLLNDFFSAKQKYLLEKESLQQGQLAYEAFEERHKLGYISSLELILAKDQLYTQQVKTIQAKYNLYFKYKLIEELLVY